MMNTTMSEPSKASEITTTSEKHIETSGCVCAPRNCEPKTPLASICVSKASVRAKHLCEHAAREHLCVSACASVRRWQQMMRARVGIDPSKSWADQVEEEDEAAALITTAILDNTKSEAAAGAEPSSAPPPKPWPSAAAEPTTVRCSHISRALALVDDP